MTWRNKNNEFIYAIRIPRERDRIDQISTKNFDQNAYLDKIDRENGKYILATARGIVYTSVNQVYRYYTSFNHNVNLGDNIPHYFKQIRGRDLKQEKRKER